MLREEDEWKPSSTMDVLRHRALWMQKIRHFFNSKGYFEVETPIMGRYGITDVYLRNIQALFRGQSYALQTSPEYHMKRLLAAQSGPIFQLSRVFRDDELGRWHNPEFTLLEWYQLDVDHHTLLVEVDELFQTMLGCLPLIKRSYQEVFQTICGIDPLHTDCEHLREAVARFDLSGVLDSREQDKDAYLFLLMSHVVEPSLATEASPVAVIGFPPSQASLAKIEQGCASRFEVYYRGVELANGFHELTDPKKQAARFALDNEIRMAQGEPPSKLDPYLLQALNHGLPECSGVAVGMDRLLALSLGHTQIATCMAFDFSRA